MSATVPHRDELEADAQRLLAERREQAAADELAQAVAELQATRDREAAEARESAQREKARRAHEKADTARNAAVQAIAAELASLGEKITGYVESEHGYQVACVWADRQWKSLADTVTDLIAWRCQQAGLRGGALVWINNAWGNRLDELYAPAVEPDRGVTAGVENEPHFEARCSICTSGFRDQIEQALAAGQSLRTIEGEYGVSRSAVARHKEHAGL